MPLFGILYGINSVQLIKNGSHADYFDELRRRIREIQSV